jgi:hypothetical protein
VFEGVAEAFRGRPDYDHVSFLIPEGELTLTVQPVPDGPIIGLAHGHQARKGGAPLERIKGWVSGQAFGFRAMGDASIILVGHYHQYAVNENGGRVIFIAPTIDSGSQWFRETAGVDSTPGMLSLLVTRDGWQDAQLL